MVACPAILASLEDVINWGIKKKLQKVTPQKYENKNLQNFTKKYKNLWKIQKIPQNYKKSQ